MVRTNEFFLTSMKDEAPLYLNMKREWGCVPYSLPPHSAVELRELRDAVSVWG